jgi:hypothetical protein
MKSKDIIFSSGIVVLVIAVVVVVFFKFVSGPGRHEHDDSFRIDALDNLVLTDMNNNSIKFPDLLDKNKETYCLLFEMTNCYSCIYYGIEDLKKLKKAGKACMAIVVDDRLYEVVGWSEKQGFSSIFMLGKVDFYDHIRSPTLPVMVKIKDGEVKSFRYITP